MRILGLLLEERLEMEAKYGPNWSDKPVCAQMVLNVTTVIYCPV